MARLPTMNLADFIAGNYEAAWFKQGVVCFEVEMKAVHPLRPWMFLRTTCRKMVRPCVVTMAWRLRFLESPEYVHNTYLRQTQLERLRRIQESGWFVQLWLPDDDSIRSQLQRKGLLFDSDTLAPSMMHPEYWEELRKRVGNAGHGWVNGKLQL